MAHIFRFIAETIKVPSELESAVWLVSPEDQHHLRTTLRLKEGDLVEVTDGKGTWGTGQISKLSKQAVYVETKAIFEEQRGQAPKILVVGMMKPHNIDGVVAAASEIGIDQLWAYRSEHAKKGQVSDATIERWVRLADAAGKQCKRAHFLKVEFRESLVDALDAVAPGEGANRLYVLSKDGDRVNPYEANHGSSPSRVICVVGSEAGFTASEWSFLQKRRPSQLKLGDFVLRSTTAAIAAAVWMTQIN